MTKTQQLILNRKEANLAYARSVNKPKLVALYEHTLALYKKELARQYAPEYNNPLERFAQNLETAK